MTDYWWCNFCIICKMHSCMWIVNDANVGGRCKGGISFSLMTVALSHSSLCHRPLLFLTSSDSVVRQHMCFRAGLGIHLKAGSQRALWVTEMERTQGERESSGSPDESHKEKREWKLSPHSPLSFSFSPSFSQFPTHLCSVKHIRVSTGCDWWLTEVSWCLWTFSSRKFRRYVAAGSMTWFRCANVSAGIFIERLCFLGCLDVCSWIEISHVWSLQTSYSLSL